jgi:hypothetical protein
MKPFLVALVAAGTASVGTFAVLRHIDSGQTQETHTLRAALEAKETELIGYTKYTTFIAASKQALQGEMKLLAATVKREEGVTQLIERLLVPGLKSSGTVAIWYSAEYSFGFDLKPDQYELRAVAGGLELSISKPGLVSPPAITNLRHKVLTGGVLTDEKSAALKLQEDAAGNALKQGRAMAHDPAIVALCEKKLVEFLRSFLQKQPGVTQVPHIRVVYRKTDA